MILLNMYTGCIGTWARLQLILLLDPYVVVSLCYNSICLTEQLPCHSAVQNKENKIAFARQRWLLLSFVHPQHYAHSLPLFCVSSLRHKSRSWSLSLSGILGQLSTSAREWLDRWLERKWRKGAFSLSVLYNYEGNHQITISLVYFCRCAGICGPGEVCTQTFVLA